MCIAPQAIIPICITKQGCEKCRLKDLHFATSYPLFIYAPSNVAINNSDYTASIFGMINEWRIEMDVEGGECRLFEDTTRHPPGD